MGIDRVDAAAGGKAAGEQFELAAQTGGQKLVPDAIIIGDGAALGPAHDDAAAGGVVIGGIGI